MFGFGEKKKPKLSADEQLEEALQLSNAFHGACKAVMPFSNRAEARGENGGGDPYTAAEIEAYGQAIKQLSESIKPLVTMVRDADRSLDVFPDISSSLNSCARIYADEVAFLDAAARRALTDAQAAQSDGLAKSAQQTLAQAHTFAEEAAAAEALSRSSAS